MNKIWSVIKKLFIRKNNKQESINEEIDFDKDKNINTNDINFAKIIEEDIKTSNTEQSNQEEPFIIQEKEDKEHGEINVEKNSIKITNIDLNLIDSIANNDIVIVQMDEKSIALKNVKKYHQKRPFIVKEKNINEQSVFGYYLTSNTHYELFEEEKFIGLKLVLNENNYALNKNSLVELDCVIKLPFENIIYMIDHLNNKDLNKLKKYRNLLYGNPVISNKENKLIESCDVILDNEVKYIIYQSDNTNSHGYPILETDEIIDLEKNHNYIKFNKKIYFIDYKNNKVFSNNSELFIVERWNQDVVDTIRNNKKLLKYESKNKSKIKKK